MDYEKLLLKSYKRYYSLSNVKYHTIWVLLEDFKNIKDVGVSIKFIKFAFKYNLPKWILNNFTIGECEECDGHFLLFEYKHNSNFPLNEKELEDFK